MEERSRIETMSRPKVTITLGRSGQKVVKSPWSASDGLRTDSTKLLGYKRAINGTNVEESFLSTSKRFRGDGIGRGSGYGGFHEVEIDGNDLRLKLSWKRMANRIKLETAERKKIEMTRTSQSNEGHGRSLQRNMPSTRRTTDDSYDSHRMGELRLPSSRVKHEGSKSIASSGFTDEMVRLPLPRPSVASRNVYRAPPEFSDVPRLPVPTMSTRTNLNGIKPITELLPPSTSMLRSTFPDEPVTVSGLLHSLGLSKYSILFQAEEVDMAVLKQMGDRDLKELGIPMGPRKKILVTLMARSRRPITVYS